MLKIIVPGTEFFDEEKSEFFTKDDVVLELEHSLVSLSKWESIWEKPFLSKEVKTEEETSSYVACMIVTPDFPEDILQRMTEANFDQIQDYINKKMTATWFPEIKQENSGPAEIITAELIYYWMSIFNIPFECDQWNLSKLFTLIQVCNRKNSKPKKSSPRELAARNRELNAQRRAKLNSKG